MLANDDDPCTCGHLYRYHRVTPSATCAVCTCQRYEADQVAGLQPRGSFLSADDEAAAAAFIPPSASPRVDVGSWLAGLRAAGYWGDDDDRGEAWNVSREWQLAIGGAVIAGGHVQLARAQLMVSLKLPADSYDVEETFRATVPLDTRLPLAGAGDGDAGDERSLAFWLRPMSEEKRGKELQRELRNTLAGAPELEAHALGWLDHTHKGLVARNALVHSVYRWHHRFGVRRDDPTAADQQAAAEMSDVATAQRISEGLRLLAAYAPPLRRLIRKHRLREDWQATLEWRLLLEGRGLKASQPG